MVEPRDPALLEQRREDVLPPAPPDRDPVVNRDDPIALEPDPEVAARVVLDIARRRVGLDGGIVDERGLAPPPLLLQDEQVDPEVLRVRPAPGQNHHLGRAAHLRDRAPGLVRVLGREDDRGPDLLGHAREQGLRSDRVRVEELDHVARAEEERHPVVAELAERPDEARADRLEERVADQGLASRRPRGREVLLEGCVPRHDHGRDPRLGHGPADQGDVLLLEGEDQVRAEEGGRDQGRVLRVHRERTVDPVERAEAARDVGRASRRTRTRGRRCRPRRRKARSTSPRRSGRRCASISSASTLHRAVPPTFTPRRRRSQSAFRSIDETFRQASSRRRSRSRSSAGTSRENSTFPSRPTISGRSAAWRGPRRTGTPVSASTRGKRGRAHPRDHDVVVPAGADQVQQPPRREERRDLAGHDHLRVESGDGPAHDRLGRGPGRKEERHQFSLIGSKR